jgi:hypothetical protein
MQKIQLASTWWISFAKDGPKLFKRIVEGVNYELIIWFL